MSNSVIVNKPKRDIEGVKPEIAEKIYNILSIKNRRYFGSAGASLSWPAFSPDWEEREGIDRAASKVGLEGERDTSKFLQKWIKDKPNVVLVDSAHIRGWGKEEIDEETGMIDGGDTDHILIIGDEIILIDTKRWKKKSGYSVGDDGQALRSNKSFPGGNLRTKQAMNLWLDYLDSDAKITSFVCINNEEITVFRNRNWYTQSFRLVEIDRFEELLNKKWDSISDYDKSTINSTLVSQIVVSCVKPYDPYARVLNMKEIKKFS